MEIRHVAIINDDDHYYYSDGEIVIDVLPGSENLFFNHVILITEQNGRSNVRIALEIKITDKHYY